MEASALGIALDRWLARSLPGDALKDLYTRGMRRVAETTPFKGRNVMRTRYGFDIEVDRFDALKWCLHYFGAFEPQISEAWTKLIRPGGTVVDLGGNVGYHAMLAASLVGPSGRVLTFEPCRAVFDQLVANAERNGFSQITATQAAVCDEVGFADLHCLGDNEQAQGSLSWRDGVHRLERVPTITFDQAAEMVDTREIDLIKLDVEGAEDRIVPIMSRHDFRDDCVMFIEIGPQNVGTEVLAPLLARGFHGRRIGNTYDTRFYRSSGEATLEPLAEGGGIIQDVVLSRDLRVFDTILDQASIAPNAFHVPGEPPVVQTQPTLPLGAGASLSQIAPAA